MSILKLRHLAYQLKQKYSSLINMDDISENDKNRDTMFKSRAFTAYSLQVLASISKEEAANSITDGKEDGGIDAIYFDRTCKTLWLVQGKWISRASGVPEQGDTMKFCSGIRELIQNNFSAFNNKVKLKQHEVEDALNDYNVKIKVVLAYTGESKLSSHVEKVLSSLIRELSDDNKDLISYETFHLDAAYKSLAGILDGQPITSELYIDNFGKIDEPHKCVYGIVNGKSIALLWEQHGNRLFSENIRGFLGENTVNDDIKNTIIENPSAFFYFNNGITILCDSFAKKPLNQGAAGTFEVKNLKIVNGAQTVGSIGRAYSEANNSVDEIDAFVKIISLSDSGEEFGEEITKKTNTQNKIEKRDFVSLDPQQERLKTDFSIMGITYQIKRSSEVLDENTSCTIEDVIISVACSLDDVEIAVTSKHEVGQLWDDIKSEPYTKIINDTLSALFAWRCVLIMRKIRDYIKEQTKKTNGRKRQCLTHSNRFALHLILNAKKENLGDEGYDFDTFLSNELPTIIQNTEDEIYKSIDKLYKKSLIHQIFRNQPKCRDLKQKIKVEEIKKTFPIKPM